MRKSWELDRRTFLQGLGISIALPVLDAMIPSMARAATPAMPRFAAIYIPTGMYGGGYDASKTTSAGNGILGLYGSSRYYLAMYPGEMMWPGEGYLNSNRVAGARTAWNPANTGPLTAPLPVILSPLEALKQNLTIVSGTSMDLALQHRAPMSWLSDVRGTDLTPRTSLDQFIANYYNLTPGSTIVFNPIAASTPTQDSISFNSKLGGTSKVPVSTDAKAKFNSLFGSCNPTVSAQLSSQQINGKSVLDYVADSISSVQKRLGKDDKVRLDAYLTNVRDLENKLTAVPSSTTTMGCPTLPTAVPGDTSGPLARVTQLNMMVDVTALALASDAMPIATIMLDEDGGIDTNYGPRVAYNTQLQSVNGGIVTFGTPTTDWHLDIAHHISSLERIEPLVALNQYEVTYFKRLVEKLAAMPLEPNGNTPLDNSIIMTGTGHADGNTHSNRNIQLAFAGGKKYGMKKGHIACDLDEPVGNLLYTLLQGMGVNAANFNGYSKKLPIFG